MAEANLLDVNVRIDNVREMRRALSKYAPEVKKALDKANREAGAPLLALARSYVPSNSPLSGWRGDGDGIWNDSQGRGWDASTIKRGLKIKAGKRSRRSPWSAVTQLRNESAAGSIFETAGSKSPNSIFNMNLAKSGFPYKTEGVTRIIWKAIKNYPIAKYRIAVLDNYAKAEKELQRIMDSMGQV